MVIDCIFHVCVYECVGTGGHNDKRATSTHKAECGPVLVPALFSRPPLHHAKEKREYVFNEAQEDIRNKDWSSKECIGTD